MKNPILDALESWKSYYEAILHWIPEKDKEEIKRRIEDLRERIDSIKKRMS